MVELWTWPSLDLNDNSDISSSDIQPVGTRMYQGADSYTARTDVISSGSDGDMYQCSVTSVGDPVTGTVTLRGNDLPCVCGLHLKFSNTQMLLQPSLN